MKVQDAIRIVQDIKPIFDMSGLNGNRPITGSELTLLSEASRRLAGICTTKKIDYLAKALPELVTSATVVHLHCLGESTRRMLEARKR